MTVFCALALWSMLDLRCVNVIHSNFLHKESLAELLQHVSLVPNLFLVFLSAPLLLPLVPTWLCLLPGYEFATANWMDDNGRCMTHLWSCMVSTVISASSSARASPRSAVRPRTSRGAPFNWYNWGYCEKQLFRKSHRLERYRKNMYITHAHASDGQFAQNLTVNVLFCGSNSTPMPAWRKPATWGHK